VLLLALSGGDDALADVAARLALGVAHELFLVEVGDFEVDIDAIEEGSGTALEAGAAKLRAGPRGWIMGGVQEQAWTVSP
jgi:hypothetical protein